MRALLVCLAFLLAVAPATAANPVRATLAASSTRPVAETPWRWVITVKDRQGRALPARARLQILRRDAVVRCLKGKAMVACRRADSGSWISFRGRRAGTVRWPAASAGATLVFQAIVVADGRSLRLRVPVRVQAP